MFLSMNWIGDFVDLSGLDKKQLIRNFTLSTAEVEDIYVKGEDTYGVYFAYELLDGQDKPVSEGTVLFCAPKHFRFADPALTVRREGDELVVTAKAYARSVEILAGADTVLSDNYFDMNAGERRVKILRGEPGEDLAARSVYDIK